MKSKKKTSRLETTARAIGVVYIIAWLIFVVFRISDGDFSSFRSLLPPFVMLLLILVALQNRIVGGSVLLVAGIVISVRYAITISIPSEKILIALITGGPYILVGVLYLLDGIRIKRS